MLKMMIVEGICVYACGYPYSKYYISEDGMYLYSCRSNRRMTYNINNHGYYHTRVTLDTGAESTMAVHRLVCSAFHTPTNKTDMVLHIDNCKLNIHKDNLRYGSAQENIEQEKAKTFSLAKDGNIFSVYNISKFCRENSLDISRMYKLLNGNISEYGGYTCAVQHIIDHTKGKPKLSYELVVLLRHLKSRFNISYKDLAEKLFNNHISFTTICNAVRGNSWRSAPLNPDLCDVELAVLKCLELNLIGKLKL